MTTGHTVLALRSRAALEEQAGYTAWMLGHRRAAIRHFTRCARHTLAAHLLNRKIEKGGSR